MKYLAAALLLLGATTAPVAAQTARIAHYSHSGSLETLASAVAEDNFGWYQPSFHTDSARLLSEKVVLLYGRWSGSALSEKQRKAKTDTLYLGKPNAMHSPAEVAALYQKYYPQVKLIGFDGVGAVDKPSKSSSPEQKTTKRKTKQKKKAAFVMPSPAAPAQSPGIWLAATLVVGLAGAGWLLGERRPAQFPTA